MEQEAAMSDGGSMGSIHLRPRVKRRLADELYGQLLEQIISGALSLGDKLPTEHQISVAFQVSRPVVREALMRLQADGLVEARRGSGSFLRHAPSPEIRRFLEPVDFAGFLRATEIRLALEPEAARYAAQRHTAEDLTCIRTATDALAAALAASGPSRTADIVFHRAVALASGNELFARQLDNLSSEMEGFIGTSLGLTLLGSPERRKAVLQEHAQITDAIAMRDGDLAAVCMRYHLSQARRRLTDMNRQP